MTQHTPGPWTFNPVLNFSGTFDAWVGIPRGERDNEHTQTVMHISGDTREEAEANRAFVERAVHSHDELLEALQDVVTFIYDTDAQTMTKVRAAIAKATT